MEFNKIHNKGQAQLFKNQYLEYLTKTHPLVIWGMYLPVLILLPYYATTIGFDNMRVFLTFLGGMFFWSFFEYIMHRFVYHFVSENKAIQRFVYLFHANHHEYPRDKQRLFMPPVPSLILASLIFGAQYFFLREYTFMFFPGFLLGYLIYGSMHYAIHAWNPPTRLLKPLWRNHHLHHYKGEEKGFGVSSSIWDYIFRTSFDLEKEKEDKAKVRELMFNKQ